MALQRDARYPGRWTAASSGHPQGAFKNRSAPGALDGSYIEQDWANDWDAFFSSLLNAASITPNGNVDAVGSSQYFTALNNTVGKGRLLAPQFLTASGTVTKTAGVTRWRVRMWGGGGQGGGTASTNASQVSTGGGGSSGSYAEAWFDVTSITTATLVIGAGGSTGAAGANGTAGGTSTLTLGANNLTCPGGPGGVAGGANASLPNEGGSSGAYSSAPTQTGALLFFGTPGGGATTGLNFSLASAQPGVGGSTGVGFSRSASVGSNAVGYGSGGSGARSLVSTGANNGPSGAPGLCIIEEYVL